jgi:hypothetical protein
MPILVQWLPGRAAQGTALGLTALMIGVARDHVPGEKSGPVNVPGEGSALLRAASGCWPRTFPAKAQP